MEISDYWQTVIGRQFAAAIQMLRSAIEACPDDLWDDRADGTPFWHLTYHALFYTDFYLSDDVETFQARDYHEDKAHFLPGDYQEYGGVVTTPGKGCGFSWYELNVGEFLLNNLRHTQHHTGQLIALLRRRADIGIDWLGTRDNQPPPPTWDPQGRDERMRRSSLEVFFKDY